jgi:hypothetical protein
MGNVGQCDALRLQGSRPGALIYKFWPRQVSTYVCTCCVFMAQVHTSENSPALLVVEGRSDPMQKPGQGMKYK